MSAQPRFGCYVGNIDSSITLDRFKQLFAVCGTIVDASLNGKETDPYRYGFIDFSTDEARQKAMKYNGTEIQGRKLKVGISKGNVNKPEGYSASSAPTHATGAPLPSDRVGAPMGGAMPNTPNLMDPNMQLLVMQLLQQNFQQNSIPPQQAANVLASMRGPPGGMPPMAQGGWNNPGGYVPPHPRGPMRGMPANPQPSEEVMKLRELQKQQYLEVVRREAEEYKKHLQEKGEHGGEKGALDDGKDSDSSDNEESKKD